MKKNGLTLIQIKVAEKLAFTNNKVEEIAEELGVSAHSIRSWKSDLKFKVFVFQLFEEKMEYERAERIKRTERYLKPVYRYIERKLEDKESLRLLGIKDLLKIMAQLQYEIRQDKLVKARIAKEQEPERELDGDEPQELENEDSMEAAKVAYLNERRAASNKVVPLKRG
jgi:transposase